MIQGASNGPRNDRDYDNVGCDGKARLVTCDDVSHIYA